MRRYTVIAWRKVLSKGVTLLTVLILSACTLSDIPESALPTPIVLLPTVTPLADEASLAQPTASGKQVPEAEKTSSPTADARVAISTPVTLVGAGDIATCGGDGDDKTAKLLGGIEGTVFTLGDNVYDNGSASEYKECYDPTWGRHKARTRPAAGNHDYRTDDAGPYFRYFGDVAGGSDKGYYSYELGAWHIVVLNSNCAEVEGGCGEGSAQIEWLREDLEAHPARCTLAYWHHPLFSAGKHGGDASTRPFWEVLYNAGAEIVMSGHDHDYQRFALQAPSGAVDKERGIRQFVVGTGGAEFYEFENDFANIEARNTSTFGVLKLTLHSNEYDWEFVPVEGGTFIDAGSGTCH